MNELLLILGQQQTQEGGSAWSGMIMIVAMIVIFYFFMIRPQSKKQKELKKAREAMKKGDRVITAGGIHGRIKEIKDNVILVEIAQGVTISIDKTSVFADPNAKQKTQSEKTKKEVEVEIVKESGDSLEEAAGKVAK